MRRWLVLYWTVGIVGCGMEPPPQDDSPLASVPDAGPGDAGDEPPDAGVDPPVTGECELPDSDGDCVPDARDVCPHAYDPEQLDADFDGVGNVCAPPPLGTCNEYGACWLWPRFESLHPDHALAFRDELWVVHNNDLWRYDGLRWSVIRIPKGFWPARFAVTDGGLWVLGDQVTEEDGPYIVWLYRFASGSWQRVADINDWSIGNIDEKRVWWRAPGGGIAVHDGQTLVETTWEAIHEERLNELPRSEWWKLSSATRYFDGTQWVDDNAIPCQSQAWLKAYLATPGERWVVCGDPSFSDNVLWRHSPTGWKVVGSVPLRGDVRLDGTSADDLWLSAHLNSTIHRFDGRRWHLDVNANDGYFLPVTIVGEAARWAVSSRGDVLRRDGGVWLSILRARPGIYSVTGNGRGGAWVSGSNGLLARRDEGRWSRVQAPYDNQAIAQVGVRDDAVWVTAARDVLENSGRGWKLMGLGSVGQILALPDATWLDDWRIDARTGTRTLWSGAPRWKSGDSEANLWGYSLNGTRGLMRWNEDGWDPDSWTSQRPVALDARHGEAWTLHRDGQGATTLARRTQADGWQTRTLGVDATRLVVRAPGEAYVGEDNGRVWLVTDDGLSFVRSGCGLVRIDDAAECLSRLGLEPLMPARRSPERLAAVGGRLVRFDGLEWMPLGESGVGAWSDGTRGLLLRENGIVQRYEAGAWTDVAHVGAGAKLWSDGRAVFAAWPGSGGIWSIVRFENGQRQVLREIKEPIADLSGADGALYVAFESGRLTVWDGRTWSDVSDGAVWGSRVFLSPGALWAASDKAVLRREGERWERVETPAGWGDVRGLWGDEDTLWVATGDAAWRLQRGAWARIPLPAFSVTGVGAWSLGAERHVFVGGPDGLVRLP